MKEFTSKVVCINRSQIVKHVYEDDWGEGRRCRKGRVNARTFVITMTATLDREKERDRRQNWDYYPLLRVVVQERLITVISGRKKRAKSAAVCAKQY